VKAKSKLSKEERILEASFAEGNWKSAGKAEVERVRRGVKAQLENAKKDTQVNLRLPSELVELARAGAAKHGMPYQTLIASVIHKFFTNQFVEREKWEELLDRVSKAS
jgi:predicted DNA binding CopG/RHH family protein